MFDHFSTSSFFLILIDSIQGSFEEERVDEVIKSQSDLPAIIDGEQENRYAEQESDVDDQDDKMETHLNPDAAEFVPTSPVLAASPSSFTNAPPPSNRFDLLDDDVVSQSPRKATAPVMDDISLPAENDFTEISQRPSELFVAAPIASNGNGNWTEVADANGSLRPGSSSSQCSYQEMNMKEAMHGDEKQEFAADSTEAVNEDLIETFDRVSREQNPMERSFYDDGTVGDAGNNPFISAAEDELNSVQMLPESDEELTNGAAEEIGTAAKTNGEDLIPVTHEDKENAEPAVEESSISRVVHEMATEVTSILSQFDDHYQDDAPKQSEPTDFGASTAFEGFGSVQSADEHVIEQANALADAFEVHANEPLGDFQVEPQNTVPNVIDFGYAPADVDLQPVQEPIAAQGLSDAVNSELVEQTAVEAHPVAEQPIVPLEIAPMAVAAAEAVEAKSAAPRAAVEKKASTVTKRPIASVAAKTTSKMAPSAATRAPSKSPLKPLASKAVGTLAAEKTAASVRSNLTKTSAPPSASAAARKPLANGVSTLTKKPTSVAAARAPAARTGSAAAKATTITAPTTSTTTAAAKRAVTSTAPKTSSLTAARVPLSAR